MRWPSLGDKPPWWLWIPAALVVYLYFSTETRLLGTDWGFPLDDSWIHLQFARNLWDGLGLTYDGIEPSTGSTAPLWTALLSPLFVLPGNIVLWVKLLGALCYFAVVAATWRLGRSLGLSPAFCLLATLLTLSTSWLAWSALSGMEVLLFTALTLAGMVLHLEERRFPRRPPLALAVFAISTLARPEGLLLLVLAAADRLLLRPATPAAPGWRETLLPLISGGLLALAVLLPTVWALQHLGDSPLPSTFDAKAWPDREWLPDLRFQHVVFGILFKAQPWMTLFAMAGVLTLLRRLGTEQDRGLLPALWLLALPPAYSLLTPPGLTLVGNFGRYFFPLFPVVVLLGTLGLSEAVSGLAARLRLGRLAPLALALGLLALFAPTLWATYKNLPFYGVNVREVQQSDVTMARYVAQELPRDALVAVEDIGAFKFFAPQRLVDLVGLVSPDIRQAKIDARLGGDLNAITALNRVLEERKPDYALVFTTFRPVIFGDPTRYRPLASISVPNNITMAGDTLVLYATPWCRYPIPEIESAP